MKPVAVAWLDREHGNAKRWCRARYKRTTEYQDHVRTRCGFVVNLPVGLDHEQTVDCPMCLAREAAAKARET